MIALYVGGYPSERVNVAFRNKKEMCLVEEGREKLQEPLTFEYLENDKMVAKVTIGFSLAESDGYTEVADIYVESGYRHKQYHQELSEVISEFMEKEVKLKSYDYAEEVIVRSESIYAGYKAIRRNGELLEIPHVVTVSYDTEFDRELSYFESKNSLYVKDDVVFEKVGSKPLGLLFFHMSTHPDNPSRLIVNQEEMYHSIAQLT